MGQLLPIASSAIDLLLVVLGFGLIIVVHELGHFLAARWAGIRVLAFAVGFGPALLSYRKGMGLRRGSSEPAYRALLAQRGMTVHDPPPAGVSPTEYRLNWLPFGGYVKMLGQEDANPAATSNAPDSYQRCHPAKRLVVISAGVVANVVLAAGVFMLVFMVGLRTEPPRLGVVARDGPAARAQPVALAGEDPPAVAPGLKPGDTVLRIDGKPARSFNDLVLASAMAHPGQPIEVLVQRPGIDQPLAFRIEPETSQATGLQDIGIAPALSNRLYDEPGDPEAFDRIMAMVGLAGVPPGAELLGVEPGDASPAPAGATGDDPPADATDRTASPGSHETPVAWTPIEDAGLLAEAFAQGQGRPLVLVFRAGEQMHRVTVEPTPAFQQALVALPGGAKAPQTHLLGMAPVMAVGPLEPTQRGYEQGLREGDLFLRLGALEYPCITAGIAEIRHHAGRTLPVEVLRQGQPVDLMVRVSRGGQVGFVPRDALEQPIVSTLPSGSSADQPLPEPPLFDRPGLRIVSIDGRPVEDFAQIRQALREATEQAAESQQGATVPVVVALPDPIGSHGPMRERTVSLSAEQVRQLHDLGWLPPPGLLSVFRPAEHTLRAEGPFEAVAVGLAETRRVMLMTYLTFARLAQGSVKVEHLKGPVGIAHLGTRVADRGLVWLLFFMALISVNLAVVNFLPLPIVDGGQFLFILYEWVVGRPVPEAVQGVATVAGLLLIGAAFLVVTFNDIRNVFTGL